MARLFRDLKVDEEDGKIRLNLYNRDGSIALRDVAVQISSKVKQQGDRWSAAAANRLLNIGEDGQPEVVLTPEDIRAAKEEDGVNLYTHKRTGIQHALTGKGNNIRFAATADFSAGDAFLVNGVVCAAKTAAGDVLWNGFFKTGAVVVCWRSGNSLTFNGGGLPGPQAAKLTPENIKAGVSVEVNGKTVVGTFTADATAQMEDLVAEKTAYIGGVKVIGVLPDRTSEIMIEEGASFGGGVHGDGLYIKIPTGVYRNKSDWHTMVPQNILIHVLGITPQKIAHGQQVAGVAGAYYGDKLLLGFTIDHGENLDQSYTVPVEGRYTAALNFRGHDDDRNGKYYAEIMKNGAYIRKESSDYDVSVNWTETFDCKQGDVIRVRYGGYAPSRHAHVVYKAQ